MRTNTARLVTSLKPMLVEDMKAKGLFRCGVIHPDCRLSPFAEVTGPDMSRLLCKVHAAYYCAKYGIAMPTEEDN